MAMNDGARNAAKKARVLRVGLTGGIASGKTIVAEMFAEFGARIIDTDEIARQVVAPGQPALDDIVAKFGPGVLTPAGELDRAGLRDIVFDDEDRRRRLEGILHPVIQRETEVLAAGAGGPYQVLVVPLLLEINFQGLVDRVLVVDCPEDMQRERLLARDGGSPAGAERMIAAQIARAERLAAADDVIDNSGDLDQTRRQVEALHHRYLALAGAG